MSNRLQNEKSPYLRQHADNPVDWYPWGEAAFEKAKREDKPVFLSIGYSTCHWCHVMAQESFEDEAAAAAINRDHIPVTWRTSLLREWLNDTFLETAFDPGEIRMLLRTRQKNGEGSYDTTDRVYLLSVQEAEAYFASDEERKCVPTQFALEFGAYRSSAEGTTLWWLRTPIYSSNDPILQEAGTYATYRIGCVGTSGQVVGVGHYLNCLYGVRPVIRVSTDGPEQLTFTKSGASD